MASDHCSCELTYLASTVQVQKYGRRKFLKKYAQASQMAIVKGFDRYDDNKWEKKAENWANQEYMKKWKNKF